MEDQPPAFFESCRLGGDEADNRVERSFFERAVGYTHESVKIFLPAGSQVPIYAPYNEHVPIRCEGARFRPQYLPRFASTAETGDEQGMSPRVIHFPLPGGDRKSLAKNLRRAQQAYEAKTAQAEAAHRVANAKLLEARITRCEAWNGLSPGPQNSTIGIRRGYYLRSRTQKAQRTSTLDPSSALEPLLPPSKKQF